MHSDEAKKKWIYEENMKKRVARAAKFSHTDNLACHAMASQIPCSLHILTKLNNEPRERIVCVFCN